MAGGWRVTARMVATALAAAAVSRAAESVRKLVAEVEPLRELERPGQPSFLEPSAHLTAAASGHAVTAGEDRVIAAQAGPHEFGPTPLIAPSHGIGFRSEPHRREPAAEMPVISRPSGHEPDDRDDVAPAAPVIMPDSVRTAAAFVQDLKNDPEVDDEPVDDNPEEPQADQQGAEPSETPEESEAGLSDVSEEPEAEPSEPVEDAAPEPSEPVEERAEEPQPDPVRALRLTAPPIEDTPIGAGPEPARELVEPPAPPAPTLAPEPAVVEAPAQAEAETPGVKGKHRRSTSAISGTVQSSHGRGLRGMRVTALDDMERVVGTTVSGTGGVFVVEDLPPGTYRVTATDEADRDFTPGWHGGPSPAKADTIKVKPGKTRRKVGVTLVSASTIDLDVDVRKKKAVVEISVTDRATGTPAEGSVRVSTKLFSAELPLNHGRTAVTLFGSAKGSPRLGKKVTVDYSGSKHTRPETATAKLR